MKLKRLILCALSSVTTLSVDFCLKTDNNWASQITEVENNGTSTQATDIPLNTEIVGNLSNSQDKDYYKYIAPGNGSITLEYNYEAGKADMKKTMNAFILNNLLISNTYISPIHLINSLTILLILSPFPFIKCPPLSKETNVQFGKRVTAFSVSEYFAILSSFA